MQVARGVYELPAWSREFVKHSGAFCRCEEGTSAGTGSLPLQGLRKSLHSVWVDKETKKELFRNKDFKDITYNIKEQKNFYFFVQMLGFCCFVVFWGFFFPLLK